MIEHIPAVHEADLINLIVNFGAHAEKRDPQDRIIEIRKNKKGYRVITTENEFAVRLAKKIHSAFKKASVNISYSEEPYEVARVRVLFAE